MCLRDKSYWFNISWFNSCDITWFIKLLLQFLSILIKIWQWVLILSSIQFLLELLTLWVHCEDRRILRLSESSSLMFLELRDICHWLKLILSLLGLPPKVHREGVIPHYTNILLPVSYIRGHYCIIIGEVMADWLNRCGTVMGSNKLIIDIFIWMNGGGMQPCWDVLLSRVNTSKGRMGDLVRGFRSEIVIESSHPVWNLVRVNIEGWVDHVGECIVYLGGMDSLPVHVVWEIFSHV